MTQHWSSLPHRLITMVEYLYPLTLHLTLTFSQKKWHARPLFPSLCTNRQFILYSMYRQLAAVVLLYVCIQCVRLEEAYCI